MVFGSFTQKIPIEFHDIAQEEVRYGGVHLI